MAGSPYEPVGGRAPRTKRRWLCFGLFLASGLLCAVVAWLFAWKPVPLPHAPESRNDRDARLKGITAAWVPFEAHEHPDQPTSLWGKIQRPYPTGAWWTNLVVGGPNNMGEGLGGAMATPYAVQIDGKKGVSLAYGLVTPGNDSLTLSVQPDLGVTIDEGISDRYVVAADDLTMAMRLETETKGKFADVLLARGSPYVTFRFEGATPAFHSDMRFESLDAVQAGAGNETAAVDPTVTVTAKTATRDKSGVPQECSARPSCVEAVLKGDCCPMPSGSYHGCCATPLESQGPATTFKVVLKTGPHWRIWTSTPVTMTWSPTRLAFTAPFTGVLRVAAVPRESTFYDNGAKSSGKAKNAADVPSSDEALLDAHVETYPTACDVRAQADRTTAVDSASIEFAWHVNYMNRISTVEEMQPSLLMLALPHHVATMKADNNVGFFSEADKVLAYRGGLLGRCKPVLGSKWTMVEHLTPITWTSDVGKVSQVKLDALRVQLKSDVMRPAGEPDSEAKWIAFNEYFQNAYWNGKECARLAALALVGEQVGDVESTHSAVAQMRSILELWLTAQNADPLVYDATYGGLVTEKGLYDHDADFGSGYYNDHHFHYGYMLYAAAVAVKFDAGFASKYRSALFALMYDIASPGGGSSYSELGIDRHAFPRARHKDFYEGHSWASGIFFMGQGKAQESSSEAVNAYYGAYLLALALGDLELADWNRVLLASEIRSAKTYYHMDPQDPKSPYPKAFAKNRMVGVLGSLSTGSVTWFGPSKALSHGIQILPVTPITEELLSPASWVRADIEYLEKQVDFSTVEPGWRAFLECERAVYDPEAAWRNIRALQTVDPGTTKTALLYWVATRSEPPNGV